MLHNSSFTYTLKSLIVCLVAAHNLNAAEPTTFEIIGSSDRRIAMSAFDGGRVSFDITVRRISAGLTHVTSMAVEHPCFAGLSDVNRTHSFISGNTTSIPITYEPLGYPYAIDTLRLTDGIDTMDIILDGRNLSAVPGLRILRDTVHFGTDTMPSVRSDSVGVVNMMQLGVTLRLDSASAPFSAYLTETTIQPQDTAWIHVRCVAAGLKAGVYSDVLQISSDHDLLALTLVADLRDTAGTDADTLRLGLPTLSVLIGESFFLAPSVWNPIPNASSVNIVYAYPASTLVPTNAVSDKADSLDVERRMAMFSHAVTDGRIVTAAGFRAALGNTSSPSIIIREVVWRYEGSSIRSVNYIADSCFITIRDAVGVEVVHNRPTAIFASPNPANTSTSKLEVSIRSQYAPKTIEVYTPHGALLYSSVLVNNTAHEFIDATTFPAGIYHVMVRTTHDVASTMLSVIR